MNFLDKFSTAAKAVLGTTLISMPELPTIMNAIVAASGIGKMPPPEDLQRAIVQVVIALLGGLLIYQIPNSTMEEVVEKKEESNDPTPQTAAVAEAEDKIEDKEVIVVKETAIEDNPA